MKERVFKIFSQVMGIPREEISENSSPDTVESWDSVKHMNLILSLEEEFGMQFSDKEIMEMLSVELILLTISEKSSLSGHG